MTRPRLLVRLVVAVVLMAGALAGYAAPVNAQEPATVTLAKSANVTSVAPNIPFTYSLRYSCSSLTTTCNGVTITDVLPPELSHAAADVSLVGDSHTAATNYNPATGTATFTMVNPMPAGTTGEVSVIVRFPPNTTPVGATSTNTATISADNAATDESNPSTVAANVTPNVAATKVLSTSPFVLDTNVTYTVTFRNPGNVNLNSPTLVDTLPQGAVFVSASGGGTFDAGTNQVTWHLTPDPAVPGAAPATYNQTVVVRYPSSVFDPNQPITNTVVASGVPLGTTTPITNQASVTNTPVAPAPAMTVTKAPNTNIVIGRNFTYTVTARNTGNTVLNPVTVTDTLPPGATFVSCSNACTHTDGTVTWTSTANLAVNGTFAPTVTVIFNDPPFAPGQTVTNDVSTSGTPVTTPALPPATATGSVTNTLVAAQTGATIVKTLATPSQFAVDNPLVQYRITVTNTGDVVLMNLVVTDPLPAGARYVSSSPMGTFDPDTNEVTWTVASLGLGASFAPTVNVEFPSPPFSPGDTVTNCSVATATANGVPININSPTPCTTNTLMPNNPAATIGKTANTPTVAVGAASTYTLTATNTGNVGLSPFVVTDFIPDNMQPNPIPATNVTFNDTSNLSANDTLQYRTSSTGPLITLAFTCTGTPQVCSAKLPVTAVQVIVTYGGQRGVGFVATVTLNLQVPPAARGRLGQPLLNGDVIVNCAAVSAPPGVPELAAPPPPTPPTQACTNQTIVEAPPVMTLTKVRTSGSPVAPPSTVSWQMVFGTSATSLTPTLNPVVTDCLPPGLDLVNPDNPGDPANGSPPASFTPAPAITRVVNAPGCNPGIAIVWSWAGSIPALSIPPGTTGTFTLNTRIQPGTAEQTLTNGSSAVAANNPTPVTSSATVVVGSGASLESLKLVKGSLDANYSKFPEVGHTTIGGSANYQLTITNTGNIAVRGVTAMDILPFVGDTSVLSPFGARDSEWAPIMAGAVTSDTTGVDVEYSTSHNPCRNPALNVAIDSPGCVPNSFTSTEPSPVSSVASLLFSYSGILAPGQTITLTWPMTTPTNEPDIVDTVAWNSFAFTGFRVDNGDQFIPAEPNKVGFEVEPYPLHLRKLVNGSHEPTPPGKYIPTGDTVTYTYLVTNPSDLSVGSISLVDNPPQTITCDVPGVGTVPAADAVIPPNTTVTCTSDAGPAKEGQHEDTATVSGQPMVDGEPAGPRTEPESDTANYFGAMRSISLVKLVNGHHEPDPPGPLVPVGSDVTFRYVVTNTGNVTLDPVTLHDNVLGDIACPLTVLEAGQSMTCTVIATAQPGQHTNTATATGQGVDDKGNPVGPPVTDTDTGNYEALEPAVTTEVRDFATGEPWTNTETTQARAFDTAIVEGRPGTPPTGELTYRFFTTPNCTGTATFEGVTLQAGGAVPDSSPTAPLAPGRYSYDAVYHGDDHYSADTSDCEPFDVGRARSAVLTVVFNAATGLPWFGVHSTGASAFDRAVVFVRAGVRPTGDVTYSFFSNGSCSGLADTTETVSLTNGTVPRSTQTGALGAGLYSYRATYSGDANYLGSTGLCELFVVIPARSGVTTTVFDAATSHEWTGTETSGASAFDTATITGKVAGFTPTGTVTYSFFTNGTCTGPALFGQRVTLTASGTVPNSNTTAPLAPGSYAFRASYSGDHNYGPSTSDCEPFSVTAATPAVDTDVFDAATGAPLESPVTTGDSAFDTATVTGVPEFTPTGTVTYSFFTNGDCTLPADTTETVTLNADGSVPDSNATGPLSPGSYSFQASYSGDTHYTSETSDCEPFSVAAAIPSVDTDVVTSGLTAHDTATVTGVPSHTPTGTLTYSFFTNGTCTPPPADTETVTLNADGTVPPSTTRTLTAGNYAFQATYNGDDNYAPSTSVCEPFGIDLATSTTATEVFDAATTAPWTDTETTGASAFDTATVTGTATPTPTGTVTYNLFANGTCDGPVTAPFPQEVTLNGNGTVPDSDPTGPLAAGSYSFQASYSGNGHYGASTSPCEPFTVAAADAALTTTVRNLLTGAAWAGTETTGAIAFDTARVAGVSGFRPTGTVTYSFFTNGDCAEPAAATQRVPLILGLVLPSLPRRLAAGPYSFEATYSGDSNYNPAMSACEPFTVHPATRTPTTVVFNSGTGLPWAGTETTGASAFDTASIRPVPGFTPTGTVTYSFFTNGDCTGTAATTQDVPLAADGQVPDSDSTTALAAGHYSFHASYSGDDNYSASTSACEPFIVAKATATPMTGVFDVATNAPWTDNETVGASAFDTAAVSGQPSHPVTGTVTYEFFKSGDCTGTPASTQTVDLAADGTVPDSHPTGPLGMGDYSFHAIYSGDSNYAEATSPCEPFSVLDAATLTTTEVFNAATNAFWNNHGPTTGASAFDTATVAGAPGVNPTGTVTYHLFANGFCTGTPVTSQVVTLTASGSVPHSNATKPLGTGLHSFQATYSGDHNYGGSESACEPFLVGLGTASIVTHVFDAATHRAWAGTEAAGASAFDTATVAGAGVAPTGKATYSFFKRGECTGTAAFTQTVTLADGIVPKSRSTGPLSEGRYSFHASYSGDVNYKASISACEPFGVRAAPAPPPPPPPAPPAAPAGPPGLAFTGANIIADLVAATASILLGSMLVLMSRSRRRRRAH